MERLRALIGTPSVSSVSPEFDQSNRPVIDLLANWLAELGYQIDIMPLPNQPQKANLIATLGQGPGGLVLSGHTDTVPFDDTGWASDPFTLSERDGRLFGLGSADMKSFFALAIEAARQFDANKLQAPLILLATADEESSMEGALSLVAADKPKAKYAIVEPALWKTGSGKYIGLDHQVNLGLEGTGTNVSVYYGTVTATPTPAITPTPSSTPIPGDVNGDGKVDIVDALQVNYHDI